MKLRYEHSLHRFLVSRNSSQWWIPPYRTSISKSKSEAQFFVNWRNVIWFDFRTFSCCIYLWYNNHALTLHMFKQSVIIFKYHLFLVWISTRYSASTYQRDLLPPCFDYNLLSYQDKRRQHDLLIWHPIAF